MIVIAFGGNLPFGESPPHQTMPAALAALEEGGGIRVTARSRLWSSPAWPDPSGPRYVNGAALVETDLGPEALLARLHAVEARFARVRSETERYPPRTLDLDLIDYDGRVVDRPDLTLPHPRAAQRAFVLLPLRDVAPDWRDPQGRALADLIAALPKADREATTLLQMHTPP